MNQQISLPTDEDRQMLRESVRGFLGQYWPADKAVDLAAQPDEVSKMWRSFGEQGLTTLGSDPSEGGLREILILMEELGRGSCPAPMLNAALANMVLRPLRDTASELSEFLGLMHEGKGMPSLALGAFDGDRNAGSAAVSDGTISGQLNFVEGMACATHLLVCVEQGPAVAVVPCNASGLTIMPTPGLAVPALSEVVLSNAPAVRVELTEKQMKDVNLLFRLGLAARARGAAHRAFEMVVEYAKVRHQFGQPIGRFQAIQHKLANCLMSLDGAMLTINHAATCYDHNQDDWRIFASAACAYAGPALRQVSLETHHTFAAIGYAEEHEAPRHFRRVHGDLVRCGGVLKAREELAEFLLGSMDMARLPEYDLGAAGNAFREEVRAWLAEHWLGERKAAHERLPFEQQGCDVEFAQELIDKGWIGIAWPKAFGGQERSPMEELAFIEEMDGVDAPMATFGAGPGIVAPAIMAFGTPEQMQKYIPLIARNESRFCLGYSETESGSDLASLRTKAVPDGDDWIINGQKIWCTLAEESNYIWLAARTDPEAKPQHAGISVFLVSLDSPGISIEPSMAMYGHTFCNVFFDDVRAPADALVGKVNSGWKVITMALASERLMMGGLVSKSRAILDELTETIKSTTVNGKPLSSDPIIRDRIGALAADLEVARQFVLRTVRMMEQGKVPVYEAGTCKAFSSELQQRIMETAIDILGMEATLSMESPSAPLGGKIEQMLRQSIVMVVGGGTNEIQRNLIAVQGLRLPR